MARKRSSSEGGISLDSLMDALTNVVAVLILVLILVQADVSRKVQQFIDDLLPATAEEVAQSQSKVTELERQLSIANARLMEKPPTPEEISEIQSQIRTLETSLAKIKEYKKQSSDAQQLLAQVQSNHKKESDINEKLEKEIQDIEAKLEALPALDPDTPTVVNIPNIRPIPEKAQTYYAIAFKERIHIIDPYTPLGVFEREFDRRKGDWLINRVKVKGKPDKLIYDGVKIANHFKTFNWGNSRGQKIEVLASPTSWNLYLVIRPDIEKGGTPLEALQDPNSEFANAVRVISRGFGSVLFFHVHSNSFKSYLAAREQTERANIAAGWEIKFSQEVRVPIEGIIIKRLQEPQKPAAGTAPKPPALKPKLD